MKNKSSFKVGRTLATVTCALSALLTLVSFNAGAGDSPRIPVISASDSGDDGHVAANAIDGSLATRWSADGNGQWIRFDLGTNQPVGSVAIAWYEGNTRTDLFDIQTSPDGTNWNTVYIGHSSGTNLNLETYPVIVSSGRYVRIVGYGNTVNSWNSITEVELFGPPPAEPPAGLRLMVDPASPVLHGSLNSAPVSFKWNPQAGATYHVQASPNLVSWQNVGAPITNTSAAQVWIENVSNLAIASWPARFYRVVQPSATTPPAAGFAASPAQGAAPLTAQFTDHSTGSIMAWNWNFGDSSTSTAQNPSHTYSSSGNFTATLTVTGSGGQTSSASHTITVTLTSGGGTNTPAILPTVSAISVTAAGVDSNAPGLQIYPGTTVQFSATATNAQTWQWSCSVNGGAPVIYTNSTSPITNISYYYDTNSASNSYVWTLVVSNGQAWAESQTNLEVENVVPSPTLGATSQVLNLTNWKLTLPIGSPGSPTEITQPALAAFLDPNYFFVNAAGDGVVFTAPCGGVTTSGSSYPRSELREMVNNGSSAASWSTTSGISTMEVTEAITHLPVVKPQVIAGQIHDGVTKVIDCRLGGSKLYIENASGGTVVVLTSNYVLGTKFTFKWVVQNGGIAIYYNGQYVTTYSVSDSGCYFKVGDYTQSNTSTGDSPTAYGQVVVYSATVSHQ